MYTDKIYKSPFVYIKEEVNMDQSGMTAGIGPVWNNEGPSILQAVFANACGFFKVDLTTDQMLTPLYEIVNGMGISINSELGLEEEGVSYSFIVSDSIRKGAILSNVEQYAAETDRENLISQYLRGKNVIPVDFYVMMPVLGQRCHRYIYFITPDPANGHLIATVALYDISDTLEIQQQYEFIRAMASEYAFLFHIDLDKDSVKLIQGRNSDKVSDLFKQELRYNRYVTASAEYICGDDRDNFLALMKPENILKLFESTDQHLLIAQMKRGDTLSEEYYQFQLIRSSAWGRTHAFYLAARNIDREERARQERDNMITGLAEDYEAVFCADLDENRIRVIRARDRFVNHHVKMNDIKTYQDFLNVADAEVFEEDRARFVYSLQPDSIRAILQDKESAYINYRRTIHGVTYFYKLKLVRIRGWESKGSCLLGIRNADKDVRLEMERIQALRRANTDGLTGLLNRTAFKKLVTEHLAEYTSRDTAMIFLDIDRFKSINDIIGHAAGDEAVKQVAEILKTAFRSADPVARIGGDEFLIFIRDVRNADLETRLNKLLQDVHIPLSSEDHEKVTLSMSIGCVICSQPDMSCEQLAETADRFMYDAKSAGRDRLIIKNI